MWILPTTGPGRERFVVQGLGVRGEPLAARGGRWVVLHPAFSTGVSIAWSPASKLPPRSSARWLAMIFRPLCSVLPPPAQAFFAFRQFVVGFYILHFRDLFFAPAPPSLLFCDGTVLEGK